MKNILLKLGAVFLLLSPLLVLAQSSREIYAEANAMAAADDRKLNAVYEKLLGDIRARDESGRAAMIIANLRESQRAWLKYRDAQIRLVGVYNEIGSASARAGGLAQYTHDLTEARLKDLQAVPNPF